MKYYTEPERNVYVEATEEQLNQARISLFVNKLKGDMSDCPHTVFYDTDSYMYTERRCYACKAVIELI